MSPPRRIACAAMIVASAGCYHATIETGAPPSTEVINQSFASSWIYGLIPPKTVETASRCPNGVAKVETQHSFVNQLVGFVTLGIYTPMQITVTCAARTSSSVGIDSSSVVARGSSQAALQEAFTKAVARSVATREPVYLRF